MNSFKFKKGEKRELTAVVNSKNPKDVVVIASSEYELKKSLDGSIVQKGSCEIEGNEATVFLDLSQKGKFELEITSSVGREVIKSKSSIVVE